MYLCWVAGLRNGNFEEAVDNNSSIYALNALALAAFSGLAAFNPSLVSLPNCYGVEQLHSLHSSLAAGTVPSWTELIVSLSDHS